MLWSIRLHSWVFKNMVTDICIFLCEIFYREPTWTTSCYCLDYAMFCSPSLQFFMYFFFTNYDFPVTSESFHINFLPCPYIPYIAFFADQRAITFLSKVDNRVLYFSRILLSYSLSSILFLSIVKNGQKLISF